jgi:hypothetical protein
MTSPDLPALIARVRELDAEATKGPWFYNSYSGVFSEPVSREYDVAVEALPDDAPAEAFDGLVEPCCAHVPVVGGDTATAQGARDAALIAEYRTAAPLLAAECERLQLDNARLDDSILTELENRDNNAEWADKLAYAIADVETIGEHTNLNNPWSNALDAAENLHDECSRLQERVRVLEFDYDDGGAATNRELARRLLAAEKRAMVLEAVLRPFAHGCIRIDGGDELNAPTDPDCCRYCKARAALEGIESP